MNNLITIKDAPLVFAKLKSEGKTIVATNGCFDVLHIGHSRYLAESKKLGDILVVGLNSDASVRRLKGAERPINSEFDRAELLLALEAVDYVVIFEEDTAIEFLKAVQPQIYTKGGQYSPDQLPETATANELGIKIVFIEMVEAKSTTATLEKIKNA